MKPLQAALPVATWMMRISILLFLILLYMEQIKVVNFQRLDDALIFGYILSALLLVVGGFAGKDTLTIIAGALLFLFTVYFMIVRFPAVLNLHTATGLIIYFWPASVGLFFAAHGNG